MILKIKTKTHPWKLITEYTKKMNLVYLKKIIEINSREDYGQKSFILNND